MKRSPGGQAGEATAHLEGELVGFTFRSEEGAFGVARLAPPGQSGSVVVVGPLAHVMEGQHVVLTGSWQEHDQFGRQFQVKTVLIDDPRTLRGLRAYLASGAVHGLGPEMARRVVERFKLDTLKIIDQDPARLAEVRGIGKKRVATIRAHWESDRANREVFATLRGHGIGEALTRKIIDKYGKNALSIVQRSPYQLAAELRGVGFRTADQIAHANGVALDDPARAEAALVHLLREGESQGHCFLPAGELLHRSQALDVPPDRAREALNRLGGSGNLVLHPAIDPQLSPVYLPAMERHEAFVAHALAELLRTAPHAPPPDTLAAEQALGIELGAGQRAAVRCALQQGVAIITGGPGTGKTTIVRVLLELAAARQQQWVLAAPTGRAARRLAETTGRESRTIHRLLEYNGHSQRFERGPHRPLEADGVLIDEASMVDTALMADLLAAVPDGCRLVLVGDGDQLPSVGPGRVLSDLIDSGTLPVATLTEVYRQAASSGIVRNAHRVNRGELPLSGEREAPVQPGIKPDFFLVHRADPLDAAATVLEVVCDRLRSKGFDPLTDVQVLTPMHNGPLGTVALNERLQASLNPSSEDTPAALRVGDRVIQVRNNYNLDVFNGDIGVVRARTGAGASIDFDGRLVEAGRDDLRDVELAYAISIHKSQGSEYPAVVVVLHRAHHVMLRRNLLYTAMTRASRFCCIIGDTGALERAVNERGGDERFTRLADRLKRAVTTL